MNILATYYKIIRTSSFVWYLYIYFLLTFADSHGPWSLEKDIFISNQLWVHYSRTKNTFLHDIKQKPQLRCTTTLIELMWKHLFTLRMKNLPLKHRLRCSYWLPLQSKGLTTPLAGPMKCLQPATLSESSSSLCSRKYGLKSSGILYWLNG